MTKNDSIDFLKFLHNLEKVESKKGLFGTTTVATIEQIRFKFISLNQHKSKNRKGVSYAR